MSTAAQPRLALYARLKRRNTIVGVLRILVPVLGALLLAIPFATVVMDMIADQLSVAGVRLESDTLVIDAPRFQGIMANNTVYRITAARAESRIGNLDVADLIALSVDLEGEAGYRAVAEIPEAQFTLSRQNLFSNEDVTVSDTTGARAVLGGVEIDWPRQLITSQGPVRFTFENGAELVARSLYYDTGRGQWRFDRPRIRMTPTPEEAP